MYIKFPQIPRTVVSVLVVTLDRSCPCFCLSEYQMYYWYNCTPKTSRAVHYTNRPPASVSTGKAGPTQSGASLSLSSPFPNPRTQGSSFHRQVKLRLRWLKGVRSRERPRAQLGAGALCGPGPLPLPLTERSTAAAAGQFRGRRPSLCMSSGNECLQSPSNTEVCP